VFSDRRLAGQHDRIRSVEHGVGHVARLGAGGPREDDHRFEHLGRDDRRDATIEGAPDELLLDDRDLLVRQLHAEIAARDHDRIGRVEDRLEVIDRRPRLDLGHDRWPARPQQAAQLPHVVRTADE
jgi:hypothetical protein